MRTLRWMIVAAATVLTSIAAGATDQSAFLATLKKYGVTDSGNTSRKPCLCTGGGFDRAVGVVVASPSNGYLQADCSVPTFDSDGNIDGGGSCLNGGGTFVTLGK